MAVNLIAKGMNPVSAVEEARNEIFGSPEEANEELWEALSTH